MYGVDVSEHNGLVSWKELKANGIDFAIIRASWGQHMDARFLENVYNALDAGLICGAYHYSYALTPEEAKRESEFCRKVIDESGALLELPVFFDFEDADGWKSNNGFCWENSTNVCEAFIKNMGLDCGLYASWYYLNRLIDWKSLKCAVWCAAWGEVDPLKGFMWQYTDKLNIGGKLFDGDYLYSR